MSKQSKQYESMRQTQVNTFSDGLNMDLHPLTTPNTILTDCVNGTMITYNDNEFVLQNERGNTKIVDAKLNPGFIPVGMKEHNGILYIVSHNPQTKESEIGTYPSPGTNNIVNFSYDGDVNDEITYYNNDLSVSQYDSYELTMNDIDPLKVLDHYVLSDGTLYKMNLKENGEYMFNNPGSGILGYKYRRFHIDSVDVTYDSHSNIIDLYLKAISTDDYLFDKYTDYNFQYNIDIFLTSNTSKKQLDPKTEIIDWNYIYQLESVNNVKITFSDDYEYDEENKIVKYQEGEYSNVEIVIVPQVEKDGKEYKFDNLQQIITIPVSNIFTQKLWFSTFKYQFIDDKLNIEATLDAKNYNKEINKDVSYSFKLTDLNDQIYTAEKFGSPIYYYTFEDEFTLSDNKVCFKNNDLLSINDNNSCNDWKWTSDKEPAYYTYEKKDDSIIFSLFQKNNKFIEQRATCSSTNFEGPKNTPSLYNMNASLSAEKNKIYLCTLKFEYDCNDNHISEEVNFIVITYDNVLKFYDTEERMDKILFKNWYDKAWLPEKTFINKAKTNDTQYLQNKIPIEDIINKDSKDNIKNLSKEFFLKFNQLYFFEDDVEIPQIRDENIYKFTSNNECPIKCSYYINGVPMKKVSIPCARIYQLDCEWNEKDISKRVYLSNIFKEIPENEIKIQNYVGRLDYEWTFPNYAKEISYFGLKINGSNYRTNIGFLDNTNVLTSSDKINTTVIKNCKCDAQTEEKFLYNSGKQNNLNYSHSLNLTLNGGGIEHNNYTLGKGIEITNGLDKIGMTYLNKDDKYCLIEENVEDWKLLVDWYFKHLYYYDQNKKWYYFTPKNNILIIDNSRRINIEIRPNINLDNIPNLQSNNNLLPYMHEISLTAPDVNEKYQLFLEEFLKNNWTLYDNEKYKEGLFFDNNELFNDSSLIDATELEPPYWKYDQNNRILYFSGNVEGTNNEIYGTCGSVQYNYKEKNIPTVQWSYNGKIFPTTWDNISTYSEFYSLFYYKSLHDGT